jgi:prepilin-type N-terminal cleavage/methylation domain-containing protein
MNQRLTNTRRRGFTLLELIIASSLVATLMLLVWSLFSVYSKLNDKGAKRATELQLVRSLMRQLRSDLHHARAAPLSNRDSFATTAEDANDGAVWGTEAERADVVPLPPGARLLGSDTRLQLVLRASRRSEPSGVTAQTEANEFGVPRAYEVVEYVWQPRPDFLMSAGDVRAEGDFQQSVAGVETDGNAAGLTRRITPWFEWINALANKTTYESPNSLSVLPNPGDAVEGFTQSVRQPLRQEDPRRQEDTVPEVASLRFRYFDGSVWLGQWDSESAGRLPVAIEVAFDLQPEEQQLTAEPLSESNHQREDFVESSSRVGVLPHADRDIAEGVEHEYRFVVAIDTAHSPRRREEVAAR